MRGKRGKRANMKCMRRQINVTKHTLNENRALLHIFPQVKSPKASVLGGKKNEGENSSAKRSTLSRSNYHCLRTYCIQHSAEGHRGRPPQNVHRGQWPIKPSADAVPARFPSSVSTRHTVHGGAKN